MRSRARPAERETGFIATESVGAETWLQSGSNQFQVPTTWLRDIKPADVWQMYKEVYKDEPNWLKAIEHYFQP